MKYHTTDIPEIAAGSVTDNPPSVGVLLKRLTNAYVRAIDHKMAGLGITKAQSDVLFQLYQNERLSQSDLCRINNVTPATLSVLISTLVKKQLISRVPDPADPRRNTLRLRTRAQALRPDIWSIKSEVYAALIAGMSPAQLALLAEWLQQLLANLERYQ